MTYLKSKYQDQTRPYSCSLLKILHHHSRTHDPRTTTNMYIWHVPIDLIAVSQNKLSIWEERVVASSDYTRVMIGISVWISISEIVWLYRKLLFHVSRVYVMFRQILLKYPLKYLLLKVPEMFPKTLLNISDLMLESISTSRFNNSITSRDI